MADKRLVHDILSETDGRLNQRRPIAFIQHGNPDDGFLYEGICPWCGTTLCYVEDIQTKVIGGLYRILLSAEKEHWSECSANSFPFPQDFAVEITKKPLNTEKKPTIS